MSATTLAAVPDDPAPEPERLTYKLNVRTRFRGRHTTSEIEFTSLAILDGGSMMSLVGGASDEQARALRAMLFRVTVDDDGIGRDVEPRFLRDDQVSYAWLDDDEPDDDGGEPQDAPTIPADTELSRLSKSELTRLAAAHDLDTAGTNAQLATALSAERDRASTALATTDDEPEAEFDPPGAWRLVWPHKPGESLDDPYELAVDEEFPSQDAARMYGATHGSSLRRFAILLTDPESIVSTESLNNAVGQIAEAAAARPTERSRASRRSRAARTRSPR